jgi:hypothetical protein
MKLAIFLAGAASLWAQGLGRPWVGQMIDQQRLLLPVYGVSGNFIVDGPTVSEPVFASACSLNLCLAKIDSALIALSAQTSAPTPAPPGGAVIALDASGATVYFPFIRQFALWHNGTLTKLNLSVDGTVLSMASSPGGLSIAVERSGVIWVVTANGAILDSLPTDATAVLLLPALTVYQEAGAIVLRKSNGSELRFPAPGVISFTALGDGYVEAVADGVLYALRTVTGREHLFQLPPGPPPEMAK